MSSEQGPIFLNTRGRCHCEIAKAGTEYVAESSSINKSLFFLGKASCCRGHFFLPAFDCFMVGVLYLFVVVLRSLKNWLPETKRKVNTYHSETPSFGLSFRMSCVSCTL